MSFSTESDLVSTSMQSPLFKELVESLVYPTVFIQELKGYFGIPDLVAINYYPNIEEKLLFRSFAFEMKLSNWKHALMQAYRYRAFNDFSFVVIDRDHLGPPLKAIQDFQRFNIGLISINSVGHSQVHHYPYYSIPYCDQLRYKLGKSVSTLDYSIFYQS